MQTRPLGRTGHMSTLVIFGCAAFWRMDQENAAVALDEALAAGINHLDVAPQYGNAQEVVGPWLESHRDQVFLGCKTLERTADAAWADLQNSLTMLRTGVIDLYQFHAVTTFEELDQISAPGGAIETFRRARDEGLVRALGITGHGMFAPAIQLEAIQRFDLDAVMYPINPRLYAETDYRADSERLLALAQERGVGVQIIKTAARSHWGDKTKSYNTWYEPYDTLAHLAPAIQFTLSQPGVTAVVSAGDVRLLKYYIQAAAEFAPMDEAAQAALIAARAGDAMIFEGAKGL